MANRFSCGVALAVVFLAGLGAGRSHAADTAETCLGHLKDVAKSGSYYWAMRTGDYESTTNAVDRGGGKYTSQPLDRAVIPVCGETERRYGIAPKIYLCDFEAICGGWVTAASSFAVDPVRLEWFKDQKLALMMHFGLYSQPGIIESWPLVDKDAHWARVEIERDIATNGFKEAYFAFEQFVPGAVCSNAWESCVTMAANWGSVDGCRVNEYEVTAVLVEDDVELLQAQRRMLSSDHYRPVSGLVKEVSFVFAQEDLPLRGRYRFEVRPIECFGKKGNKIVSSLTVI